MVLLTNYHDSKESLKKRCTALQHTLQQIMQNHGVQATCSIGALLVKGQSISFQTAYTLADT